MMRTCARCGKFVSQQEYADMDTDDDFAMHEYCIALDSESQEIVTHVVDHVIKRNKCLNGCSEARTTAKEDDWWSSVLSALRKCKYHQRLIEQELDKAYKRMEKYGKEHFGWLVK